MIKNNNHLLGVILAGGLSRRMNNQNKFIKKIDGKTIISLIIAKALKQVNELVINSNVDEKEIKKFNLPIIKDILTGHFGPLVGILSGMEYASKKKFKWLFSFPCDAPFFPSNLVEKILDKAEKKKLDIVIAKSNGRTHPVFGLWSVNLKNSLKNALINNKIRKMDIWIEKNNFSVLNFNHNTIDPFFNINNFEDLEKANELYKKNKSRK